MDNRSENFWGFMFVLLNVAALAVATCTYGYGGARRRRDRL